MDEFEKFFPSFVWVLRDFALDLLDEVNVLEPRFAAAS